MRDTKYEDMIPNFFIDILDNSGAVYSRIEIIHPIINGMDMLSFNYTQPTAQSDIFKVEFKYSNLDYQFIGNDDDENIENL
jgi:hypothetical protein